MPWFANGRFLDVEQSTWRDGALLVRDGRIVALESAPREGEPDGIVDLRGTCVLPGLIDCHVHLTLNPDAIMPEDFRARTPDEIRRDTRTAARATLLSGVTTVRDCGGWDYIEMAVREEIAAGRGVGPRMFLSGKLIWCDSPGARDYPESAEMPVGPDGLRTACARQLDRGADFIKVMATGMTLSDGDEDPHACYFSVDELGTIVGFARDRHVKVACHAEGLDGIRNVVAAGADSVEHGTFADEATLDAMAGAGIFLVPTCMVMSGYLDDPALRAKAPPSIVKRFEAIKPRHNRVVAKAFEKGVPIAMGTDAGAPGVHHGANPQEIGRMVRDGGMTPAAAIRAATLDAARLLGQAGELGTLAPGAHADLVGVTDDPLVDPAVLESVCLVVKAGNVVKLTSA